MNNQSFKDLRKAAFAVGLGLSLGKYVGDLIGATIGGVVLIGVKHKAEKGDSDAQEICRAAKVKFKEKEDVEKTEE